MSMRGSMAQKSAPRCVARSRIETFVCGFDEIAITPGTSQVSPDGQRPAAGWIVLLTPAYVAGRFWTERELGAVLHKALLIPVLHNAGSSRTSRLRDIEDSIDVIAEKIAAVVGPVDAVC